MKWPGTHVAYALIMALFGQTTAGIHMGLILINLATAALVFLLTRRVCGDAAGVVAAGTYALLSISPPTLGLAAHATHFVMLPSLAGVLLVQNLDDRASLARVFGAGLLLGLAALMKQSGAAFGLFAAGWIVWCELSPKSRNWRRLAMRLGCLALGGLLPFIVTCSILVLAGVFDHFWVWTFQYAHTYASILTLAGGAGNLFDAASRLFIAAPGLWAAAGLGLFLLFCERSVRCWRFFVLGFAFFSFLAVCPGGYFRKHYFLLLIPTAGLLAGVAAQAAYGWIVRLRLPVHPTAVPLLLFAGVALWSLFESRDIFFQLTPAQACRAVYGLNPFPESVEIGRYLASHCSPDARIAVIGSEPQIYFYGHRHSATGYIYTYPLMEPQPYAVQMQKEMIQEIEKANPDYVVFVHVSTSWLQRPDSNRLIFDWFEKYQQEHLQLVGLVDILSANRTEYRWLSPQGPVTPPRSEYWLTILKNRLPSDSATPKLK
ncbi:MAG: glycosyltransferase family 39 protein [Verrucomicrobiia bacterium]